MEFKSFYFLIEAKQDIVNLGYPEIVAKLFYEKFGNLAFMMSRWFRDYKYDNPEKPANWWLQTMGSYRDNMWKLTYLYGATKDEESYRAALEKLELSRDEFVDLDEQRAALEEQIKRKLFSDEFFEYNDLIKAIISGELKDISQYKKLDFSAAQDKYDKQNIFKDRKAIKVYENGYKWIDVGMRCQLVGKLMKNCGSAGLMSYDDNRTLLTLFDSRNKPHVVVTYSPNEKRISSDQGIGSSEVKGKYHDYILNLAKFLGARFDVDKTKSKSLKIKYLLSSVVQNLEELPGGDTYETYFKFSVNNKVYYTDGRVVVSDDDVKKASNHDVQLNNDPNYMINPFKVQPIVPQNVMIKKVFNHLNQPTLARNGILYIPIEKFV